MDFYIFRLGYGLGNKKVVNFIAVVAIQLHHFSHLGVGDKRTIAGKILFEGLEDHFKVIFLWNPFYGGDRLASIALLDSNVYKGY